MIIERELLERVSSRVLEDAAFILATPLEIPPPIPPHWDALGVHLDFCGPFSGHCELWASLEMAKIMAANMLGMTASAPDAQEMCCDALKESLNILCGNLLTELAGADPVFDLGTPVTQENLDSFPPDGSGAEVWFDIDGQPVLIRARITGQAARAA